MSKFKQLNWLSSESGFTLVEVVVSLVLLAVVGLIIGGSLMEASAASAKAALRGSAVELLNKEVERIRTNVVNCSRLGDLLTGNFGNSTTTTDDGKQLVTSVRLMSPADCTTSSAAVQLEVFVKSGNYTVAKVASIFEVSPD